jgi:hypothetical protein
MRGPVVGGVGRIAYASAVPCARCGAFTAFIKHYPARVKWGD